MSIDLGTTFRGGASWAQLQAGDRTPDRHPADLMVGEGKLPPLDGATLSWILSDPLKEQFGKDQTRSDAWP